MTDGGATRRVQRIRIRNSRGSYDTADDGQAGGASQRAGLTGSNRGSLGGLSQRKKVTEMRKAEQRLRTIEQISKYREEKIRREFLKLEEEMSVENEKQRQQLEKEDRMKRYFEKQKARLEGYRHERHHKEMEKLQQEKKAQEEELRRFREKMERNEENKVKIEMYK